MTLFGNELEGDIKKSITYFMRLNKEDQVKILTSPLQLQQDHDGALRALWTAIMSQMALHDKDRIVASLVELGLDQTSAAILVTSITDNAPTPAYVLKEAIHSVGDSFDSQYLKIMSEIFEHGKNPQQIANSMDLTPKQIMSIFSATQSLLNNYARGTSQTMIREYLHDAKIPDGAINTILQAIETYHKQWRTINQFISIQDNNALLTKIITQNDATLNALTEILEILKGKKSNDQPHVYQ